MYNPVTAAVYERKEELGGGFRGVVVDKRSSSSRYESPVMPTIEEARYWAKTKVHELMAGQSWSPGYTYKPWRMFVWVR